MKLPINFLYLGGDKCGSTWLYNILSQHPEVTLPVAKELFYFDRFYSKGPGWYLRQFPKITGAHRTGEICHDYLYSEKALHRIAQDMPASSRFLITTRAPLDRTFSHYKYLLKIGRTSVSFDDAVDVHPQIVEHSLFGKYVTQAQSILGQDRVHVVPYELLRADAVAFGQAISRALDISFIPELPYTDRVLEAKSARNASLVRVLRNAGWVMRSVGVPRVVHHVKSHPLTTRLLYSQSPISPQISERVQSQLQQIFTPDQETLAEALEPRGHKAAS